MRRILIFTAIFFLIPIARLQSAVIDSMDSTTGWNTTANETATLSLATDTGLSGNAVKASYVFNGGQWVELYSDYSRDFSAGDEVKFYFKGGGSANNFQVQMGDSDGTIIQKQFSSISNNAAWLELSMKYSGSAPNYDWIDNWSGSGDLYFDKTKIKKISFGVNKAAGGQGSVSLDDIRIELASPSVFILDNFDDLNSVNELGGVNGAWSSNGSTCTMNYVSTVTYAGAGAAEIKYNVSIFNQYCGNYMELNSTDFSAATHLQFKVKGAAGGETFILQLREKKVSISSYITTISSTSWDDVSIPLSDFTGLVSTGPSGSGNASGDQLVFLFVNNAGEQTPPYSGTIYIDEISIMQPGATGQVSVLDTMNDAPSSAGNWQPFGLYSAPLASVAGQTGAVGDNALLLSYSFENSTETWAVMERVFGQNITDGNALRFRYKGTGGKDNIEIKLQDTAGLVFRKILYGEADTGNAWKTAVIPYEEFTYFSGGTSEVSSHQLDLRKIKSIKFAIAQNAGLSGTLWIDELEYYTKGAENTRSGKIISKLELPYNPVSPNGDGYRDAAQFIYRIAESGLVKLEIFSPRGESIYSYEIADTADGTDHTINWSVVDNSGVRVPNGIYLFRLSMESTTEGNKDSITHLIGVVR